MRRLILNLLTLATFGSVHGQVIQSRGLPALPEPSWTFADGSNTYFVGKLTGSVVVVRGGEIQPPDNIVPPPVPEDDTIGNVAWFSVIVDPNNAEQASWRTAPELRSELAKLGIQYRTYGDTERDIETLGFRPTVTKTGLPVVILQDKNGVILKAISPKSLIEVQIIAESLK